jgi:hypothetical protein
MLTSNIRPESAARLRNEPGFYIARFYSGKRRTWVGLLIARANDFYIRQKL